MHTSNQGCRQKNFQERGNEKIDRKIVKKRKIALLFQGGGGRKKDRKIVLFSLYLLNLYHV